MASHRQSRWTSKRRYAPPTANTPRLADGRTTASEAEGPLWRQDILRCWWCRRRVLQASASFLFGLNHVTSKKGSHASGWVGRQASSPAGRHQDSASKATPISGHLEAMPIYARSWSQLDSDLRLLSSSTRFWPRDQPHLSLPPTTTPTLLRPLVLLKNTDRGNGHGLKKKI